MPDPVSKKEILITPAVIVEGPEERPVANGIIAGEVDRATDEFKGYGLFDRPIAMETEAEPSSPNSKSYGHSRAYERGYEDIDWGRVTKN